VHAACRRGADARRRPAGRRSGRHHTRAGRLIGLAQASIPVFQPFTPHGQSFTVWRLPGLCVPRDVSVDDVRDGIVTPHTVVAKRVRQ